MNAASEEQRLQSLREHELLDTPAEDPYDALVALASEICGTPIALVSLVDKDRQWFKASVGLAATETPRQIAFCSHAIEQDDLFAVPNALEDERFATNPLVTGEPHIRFYTGTPLRSVTGQKLGTLCVIDRVPRRLSLFQAQALRTLGDQVEVHFALRRRLRDLREREEEVRAQRDALLKLEEQKRQLSLLVTHDLKTPLSTLLLSSSFLLEDEVLSPEGREVVTGMEESTQSMHRLVMNLLDISSAEDGALHLSRTAFDLTALLEVVQHSMLARAAARGHRLVVAHRAGPCELRADRDLVRRMLENLADNALKYGGSGGEIRLEAEVLESGIVLRVRDQGKGVPESMREKIFDKYERGGSEGGAESRGLGLAFCKLAAEAHGGQIWAEPNLPQGTAFCVRLPR